MPIIEYIQEQISFEKENEQKAGYNLIACQMLIVREKMTTKILEYQIVLKFWKWKQKTTRFILVWHHWWCDHAVNGKKLVSWYSLIQDWVYGHPNYREKIKEIQFTVLCTVQLIIRNWNWL